MERIGISELRTHASELLRRIREEGESFEITYHGKVVARLVPVLQPTTDTSLREFWTALDELATEISKYWPKGVSAVDAVREQRREL